MFKFLEYNEPSLNRFKTNELIGEGSYSKVFSVYDKKLKKNIALKIINTLSIINNENEINILKNLKFKETNHITKIFESFNYNDNLYIIYKLYDISLKNYIKNYKTDENKTIILTKQIINALDYLKQNEIVHRDIKPENIVFKNSNLDQLILIDFGISSKLKNINTKKLVQTIYYRAPEIFLKTDYDYKIDIWSLGCVCYEIFYQKPLFPFKNPEELFINHNIILDHPEINFIKIFPDIYKFYDNINDPSYIIYNNKIYAFKNYNFLKIHKEKKIINFILKCCEWDPKYRPYANQLFF